MGRSCSGLPMMLRMILNLSGSVPMNGLTLRATGLYFFLVERWIGWMVISELSELMVSELGCKMRAYMVLSDVLIGTGGIC